MPFPCPPVYHTTRSARQPAHPRNHKSSYRPHSVHQKADSPPASGGGMCPGDGGSQKLGQPTPTKPTPALYTHILLLSILVALTAVAAGEGHTVGVNVQLTHWGAGKVRASCHTPALLTDLLAWAGSNPNPCHPEPASFRLIAFCLVSSYCWSPQSQPEPTIHALDQPQVEEGWATQGSIDWASSVRSSIPRGSRAQWYLHSAAQGPPGSCDRPHRTCACRAQGSQNSELQGPIGAKQSSDLGLSGLTPLSLVAL